MTTATLHLNSGTNLQLIYVNRHRQRVSGSNQRIVVLLQLHVLYVLLLQLLVRWQLLRRSRRAFRIVPLFGPKPRALSATKLQFIQR